MASSVPALRLLLVKIASRRRERIVAVDVCLSIARDARTSGARRGAQPLAPDAPTPAPPLSVSAARDELNARNLVLLGSHAPAPVRSRVNAPLLARVRAALDREGAERCGLLVISSLAPIARGALPSEFEATVGASLRLCNASVLPATLPDERFFSYWESVDVLLQASAARAGVTITTTEMKGGSSHSTSTYSTSYYYRSSSTASSGGSGALKRVEVVSSLAAVDAAPVPSGVTTRVARLCAQRDPNVWIAASRAAARAGPLDGRHARRDHALRGGVVRDAGHAGDARFLARGPAHHARRTLRPGPVLERLGDVDAGPMGRQSTRTGGRIGRLVLRARSNPIARMVELVGIARPTVPQRAHGRRGRSHDSQRYHLGAIGGCRWHGSVGGRRDARGFARGGLALRAAQANTTNGTSARGWSESAASPSREGNASASNASVTDGYVAAMSPTGRHLLHLLYEDAQVSPSTDGRDYVGNVATTIASSAAATTPVPPVKPAPRDTSLLSTAAKDGQQAMSDAEEALAQRWWPLIRRELRPPTSRGGGKASSAWTALLLGGDLGMLGVKLAQAYPRGMVLSLRPRGTHSAAHHKLLELLRLRNNVPCSAPLGPALLAALSATEDAPHFTLLGMEAFFELLALAVVNPRVDVARGADDRAANDDVTSQIFADDQAVGAQADDAPESTASGTCDVMQFERVLGMVLTLAPTTIIEMPRLETVRRLVEALGWPACASILEHTYEKPANGAEPCPETTLLARALAAAGEASARVRVLAPHRPVTMARRATRLVVRVYHASPPRRRGPV